MTRQSQPVINPNSQEVLPAFLDMVKARVGEGVRTYGTPLSTHNGRDALQDALEEAIDLALYLMQVKMERDSG